MKRIKTKNTVRYISYSGMHRTLHFLLVIEIAGQTADLADNSNLFHVRQNMYVNEAAILAYAFLSIISSTCGLYRF